MRVLITTDVVGGVWQFAHELAAGFLRDGAAVALVSFGGDPTPEHVRQCALLQAECGAAEFLFEISSVPLEWMRQNEGAYHDAAPLLIRIAKEFNADVFHSNQFCFGALPLEIPKIVTAHSDALGWAEACRDEPLENSPWLRQYRRLVGDGLNGATAVIAPTRWMLNALKRNFPVRVRCGVIPNGRTVAPASETNRQLRAVTAGRLWDEAKDIGMLGDVTSEMPLYVAGETQHEGSRAPNHLGSVSLLGRIPEGALMDFFRESAIYMCTSRYEPFGLAPLEAALCGCALLARDIPSLREVWEDGARYFSDARTLSTLLDELANDPDALRAAQHGSQKRAQWFTAERMVASYREEFARALKDSAARAYAA